MNEHTNKIVVKEFGQEYTIELEATKYYNGRIAILAVDTADRMPFATVTVNLPDEPCGKHQAYIDVNDCPWAHEALESCGIGEWTGEVGFSGFCVYPLFDLDLSKIDKKN